MDQQFSRQPSPRCRLCALAAAAPVLLLVSLPAARASELRFTPIVKAVQAAAPSVVNIRGEKTIPIGAEQVAGVEGARRVNGMGTGVIIDPRGYIITNYHVVDGVRDIQVTTADQTRYTARLVARDAETDLAIIKIGCTKELPVISIGMSADLMPGETVVAVGNAYGYENTVTRGIVSALHRAVQVSDAQFYDDLIQTDASINPGNSGGPLLDMQGRVIGINTAIRAQANNIGFAVPINMVKELLPRLIKDGKVRRSAVGIRVSSVQDQDVARLGLAAPTRAFVRGVDPGGPGDRAGLREDDVIVAFDGEEVVGPEKLRWRASLAGVGRQATLRVVRGKRTFNLTVTLGELPAPSPF
jgi:serine protease Do